MPEKVQRLAEAAVRMGHMMQPEAGVPPRARVAGDDMQDLNRMPSMVGHAAVRDGLYSFMGFDAAETTSG